MNTLEGKAWHTISGTRGIGSRTLWLIADYLQSLGKTASWLLQSPGEFKAVLRLSKANIKLPDFANKGCEEAGKFAGRQVTVLHPLHPGFPPWMKKLKDRVPIPALLYLRGNITILKRTAVAIVGKRNAAATALAAAGHLASALAAKGINITSGYAAGIDAAAHLAALRDGGTTSIVLAEGIQHFQKKPELVEFLTEENTLVISQFEPGAKWTAYRAMTRNQLVGALSQALVVIVSGPERDASGRNSGTFNAALAALKVGIPVFVSSPGSYADNPQGNRELIKKGCLEWDPAAGIDQILAALLPRADAKSTPRQLSLFENK
jgi:DNA processing protein